MTNLMEVNLPKRVTVCEVAPRDGFQAEDKWIPTERKIHIIRELAKTGLNSMEITSFVHPKSIPQLKDAEEVVGKVQDLKTLKFRALVPNLKGAQRAIDVGIKKLKLMLSATDSHSLSNANSPVREAQEKFYPIVELADKHDVSVGGSIAVAFGCPYEGKVPMKNINKIIRRYIEMGIKEISLADTTGMGNPRQTFAMLGHLQDEFPEITFSLHFHNTHGMAMANVYAALEQGITHFDSSIAGLGGCPYAPGATGNIPTEDLVHALSEMDIETGIDLYKTIEVAKEVKKTIGHDGRSFILQAGPNSELHAKPNGQEKIERM